MKQQNYIKIAAILLLITSQIFNLVYTVCAYGDDDLLYYFIIPALSSVCLIVGMIKNNKILTAIYCVYPIFSFGKEAIREITRFGNIYWALLKPFCEIVFAVAIVLLIFNLFDLSKGILKSQAPTSIYKEQGFDADLLLEYKNLLDSGAITQEEFDAKKKEVLGL